MRGTPRDIVDRENLLKRDLAEASRLVREDDTDGLAKFLSRNAEERAKTAAAAARA